MIACDERINIPELTKQLQADIKIICSKRYGIAVTPTLEMNVMKEVIEQSAFLDGFYFEGDIIKAMNKVLK